jgi:hypothetical protein
MRGDAPSTANIVRTSANSPLSQRRCSAARRSRVSQKGDSYAAYWNPRSRFRAVRLSSSSSEQQIRNGTGPNWRHSGANSNNARWRKRFGARADTGRCEGHQPRFNPQGQQSRFDKEEVALIGSFAARPPIEAPRPWLHTAEEIGAPLQGKGARPPSFGGRCHFAPKQWDRSTALDLLRASRPMAGTLCRSNLKPKHCHHRPPFPPPLPWPPPFPGPIPLP